MVIALCILSERDLVSGCVGSWGWWFTQEARTSPLLEEEVMS